MEPEISLLFLDSKLSHFNPIAK